MLLKRKSKNSAKNLSATLQVVNDPVENQLGYMNSNRPSKPNLPNAPKPSKLLAPTRLHQTVSSLVFQIPQLAHCINQYELVLSWMWKVTFQQNMVHWRVTRNYDESRVPVTSYQTRSNCTLCLVVIQLTWLFIFLHASHMCFILASHHSRVNHESPSCCTLLIKSLHSFTHNRYIIPT